MSTSFNQYDQDIFLFLISLLVSPTIEPVPDKIAVHLGRPVRIPCSAIGHPRPTITWQKNNQILTPQMGYTFLENGMLMINSTQLSHAGRYICIAQSRAGSDVLRVELSVEGRQFQLKLIDN